MPEEFYGDLPENADDINLVDLIDTPAWKTIIIGLVKKERMDPWNIDVCALADKYLKKISLLEKQDLRVPANAILASAILLKLKARTLKISSIEEEKEEAVREISPEEIARMESILPDLKSTYRVKQGAVSLDSLVSQIDGILSKTRERAEKKRELEMPNFALPMETPNIEEKMDEVYSLIEQKADSQGMVLFSQLVKEDSKPGNIVGTFIPVLFLMNNGRIVAWQDEFFGEVFISLLGKKELGEDEVAAGDEVAVGAELVAGDGVEANLETGKVEETEPELIKKSKGEEREEAKEEAIGEAKEE